MACFASWTRSVAEVTGGEIIALDGKTLRVSAPLLVEVVPPPEPLTDRESAHSLYQRFKAEVVARLGDAGGVLRAAEVCARCDVYSGVNSSNA